MAKKSGRNGKLGPNDRCPKCGKKVKQCKGHPVLNRFCLVCILAVVCTVGGLIWINVSASNAYKSRFETFIQMERNYFQNKRPELSWWFDGNFLSQKITREFSEREANLREVLNQYQDVSALTHRIRTAFSDVHITVYHNGVSVRMFKGSPSESLSEQLPVGIEVCVIPRNEIVRRNKFPSALYYRQEWGSVMMYGCDWSDKVLPALLYHELGHALYHQVDKAASATAPPGSDLYIKEEVEMHEMESEILNATTKGQYFALIDEILSRERAKNFRDAIIGISLNDIKRHDVILEIQNANFQITSLTMAEFLIAVGLRWINQNREGSEKLKAELYRWVTTELSV